MDNSSCIFKIKIGEIVYFALMIRFITDWDPFCAIPYHTDHERLGKKR
jgi:hypothetical protein